MAHFELPPEFHLVRDDEDGIGEERRRQLIAEAEALASATFARELELWEREWQRPQAVMWERNGQEVEVALYVRALVSAESPHAKVTLRALVKQQQEALGLSLPGLARNRWVIGSAQPAGPAAPRPTAPRGRSARDRLRVVRGGAQSDD